ncbi:uncharacterized protein LOC133336936 [Musca vetustissima]|uniref:uncharacterized protein LOC133336936 n=1 Tax=Musca vetustissima TaxID=27455 RepID=UPI002AB754F9|nr:uncharacterized protein LOC133336936 [Musca vetustissima]
MIAMHHVYAEILDLGKRPKWYPNDGPVIESECMEDYSISADTIAEIKKFEIKNTPDVRSYLLCYLKEANVYRPEKGPEIKRIAWSLKEMFNLNKCDLDMIRDCVEEHQSDELKDYAYFNIIKCTYEKAPARCLQKGEKK